MPDPITSTTGQTSTTTYQPGIFPSFDNFLLSIQKLRNYGGLDADQSLHALSLFSTGNAAVPVSVSTTANQSASNPSDLEAAVTTLENKFLMSKTASQPTQTEKKTSSGFSWVYLVGAFIVAWFIFEKKFPL